MGRDMCKLFYVFGIFVCIVSLLLIRRTVVDVIPAIGLEAAAFYLGMSIFFLVIGIVLLIIARHISKKLKAEERAKQEQAQQEQA